MKDCTMSKTVACVDCEGKGILCDNPLTVVKSCLSGKET